MPVSRRGLILFLALGFVWGLPYLLIKIAVEDLSVPMVVFGRLFFAAIVLLPIVAVVGMALGFAIVGQTLSILTRVGQTSLIGSLFVTVIFRELAPLGAALVVLARVGTPTVVELGTSRALGEVEALEALGIDPVHYLVVPRVVGITLAVVSLTVYLQLFAALSGWVFCFAANLPVSAGDYLGRIAGALHWFDFPVLGLKTLTFGACGSLIACYQGLSRPLRLEEVPGAATRTVAHSVVAFLLLESLYQSVTADKRGIERRILGDDDES